MKVKINNLHRRENEAIDCFACSCETVMNNQLLFIDSKTVESLNLKNGDIIECDMIPVRDLVNIKVIERS